MSVGLGAFPLGLEGVIVSLCVESIPQLRNHTLGGLQAGTLLIDKQEYLALFPPESPPADVVWHPDLLGTGSLHFEVHMIVVVFLLFSFSGFEEPCMLWALGWSRTRR